MKIQGNTTQLNVKKSIISPSCGNITGALFYSPHNSTTTGYQEYTKAVKNQKNNRLKPDKEN